MSCRWLIQDTLKVLTFKLLYAFDIFQIRSGSFTGKAGHGPGTESLLGIHVRHNPSRMLCSTPLGSSHSLLCIHSCIELCWHASLRLILDLSALLWPSDGHIPGSSEYAGSCKPNHDQFPVKGAKGQIRLLCQTTRVKECASGCAGAG